MEPTTAKSTTWPGAFGIFKPSLRTVAFNIGEFLIFLIGSSVVQVIPNITDSALHPDGLVQLAIKVLATLISLVLAAMYTIVLLEASKGRRISVSEAWEAGLAKGLRYVATVLLSGLFITLSLFALIIPFFFVFPRLILASYYALDGQLTTMEAIKKSWQDTKGHVGKVYGIFGVTLLMALLFVTIIGIPVAIFLLVAYQGATVLLYRFVTEGSYNDSLPTVPAQQ